MKKSLFLITGIILLLTSCGPKLTSTIVKRYPALQYQEEVRVFGINVPPPPNAEKLGTFFERTY